MTVLLHLTFGFLASLIGVIPPGLLNMTAAKISISEGRKKAAIFALGVIVTVMIQTYVALLFARYLEMHPEIIDMLQKVALGIFICITGYFFFIAKDTRLQNQEKRKTPKKGRFLLGVFLAALNLLPLPYWVYMSITFAAFGWFEFTQMAILACVIGSALGTLVMLVIYIQFFKRLEKKQKSQSINMNYIIGGITGVISIITLIKILNNL